MMYTMNVEGVYMVFQIPYERPLQVAYQYLGGIGAVDGDGIDQ